jgi:hypothetical protein
MKALVYILALTLVPLSVQAAQPTFRDRYNSLAKQIAPALATRECKTSKSIGLNRDSLIECTLISSGGLLTLGALNNRLTGVLLQIDVNKLEDSADLMKAGRILLRLSRGKDTGEDGRIEMIQMVAEAQQHLGKNICEDTPEQHERFCVTADGNNIYHFGIVSIP